MYIAKRLVLLIMIVPTFGCHKKDCTTSYPELITKNELQRCYNTAKLDWYLLNATDSYSKSDYLVIYDTIVDVGTRIRSANGKHWVSDHQLLENKQKMLARFGAERIIEFVETDIVLFLQNEEEVIVNDTLTFTFFPEDNEKGQLLDLIDGTIHTLIYVNGKLTTVGQNDYLEFNVDAEEVAQNRLVLQKKGI